MLACIKCFDQFDFLVLLERRYGHGIKLFSVLGISRIYLRHLSGMLRSCHGLNQNCFDYVETLFIPFITASGATRLATRS